MYEGDSIQATADVAVRRRHSQASRGRRRTMRGCSGAVDERHLEHRAAVLVERQHELLDLLDESGHDVLGELRELRVGHHAGRGDLQAQVGAGAVVGEAHLAARGVDQLGLPGGESGQRVDDGRRLPADQGLQHTHQDGELGARRRVVGALHVELLLDPDSLARERGVVGRH